MTVSRATRAELLAPAGSMESLRAAVANGADAVYFGLEDFNARRRAENFTLAGLPETIEYLHRRNVKGYVAFNTLVFSEELERAAKFIAGIAEAGADAIIVQDIGIIRLIRRMCPTLPIHASTQTTQTHAGGIEYLRSLGVRRVILARELSVEEIGRIHRETPAELEVFVHGALCVSFSGQCLASESLFARSANRGVCAQACRLPYQLIVDGRPARDVSPAYLLSPKDLCACDHIPKLIDAGVVAFKIEGRLKSSHYVAAATRLYRQAIDAALAGEPFTPSEQQMDDLAQSFSRGFTPGFLDGNRHRELVDGRSPKTRGLAIGTVVGRTIHAIIVELSANTAATKVPLKPGDGVVFDEGRPDREEQGGRVYSVRPTEPPRNAAHNTRDASTPRCIEITFGRDDVNLASVAIGSKTWKTDDPEIRRRLESSYSRDNVTRRVPLTVTAQLGPDKRLRVVVCDDAGHEGEAVTERPLEPAQRHPMSIDLLRDQFGRLGDTPFELTDVRLLAADGLTDSLPFLAPKSVLNDLRRRAVQALMEQRSAAGRHVIAEPDALSILRVGMIAKPTAASSDSSPRLCILVRTHEQWAAVLEWSNEHPSIVATIYRDIPLDREASSRTAGGTDPQQGLATPVICKPGEEGTLARIVQQCPDVILVRNLTALTWLRTHAPGIPLVGDYSLNVTNDLSATLLAETGLTRLTPSYDLDAAQLAALVRRSTGVPFEVIIRSHTPMFHTAHCLFAARLNGGDNCGHCPAPCREHRLSLKDRVNAEHPVLPDGEGRNTVFNGEAHSAFGLIGDLSQQGVRCYRIELLAESVVQTLEVLSHFAGKQG